MKALPIILGVIALIGSSGYQSKLQKTDGETGLYLTYADFLQNKLTYGFDCTNQKDKLKLNSLLGGSKGFVLYNGEKHSFDKGQLYGYRICGNKNHRFYRGSDYLIVDTIGFYLYYRYQQVEHFKGKGLMKEDNYFFSKQGDETIWLLTSDNLKRIFPENQAFHYAIDAEFKSDQELMAYDSFLKTYKLKYLYNQSLK